MTAPTERLAKWRKRNSIRFGSWTATRSPFATPAAWSMAAYRSTSRSKAPYVQGVPSNTTAFLPGFLAAVSESSLARFIVALLRAG